MVKTLEERLRELAKDLHDCGLHRRAGVLDALAAEVAGKVLVTPRTWPTEAKDAYLAALHEEGGIGDTPEAAVAFMVNRINETHGKGTAQ